jgi:hypothetical protein
MDTPRRDRAWRRHSAALLPSATGDGIGRSPEENLDVYFAGARITPYTLRDQSGALRTTRAATCIEPNGVDVRPAPDAVKRGDYVQQCLRKFHNNQAAWYKDPPSLAPGELCIANGSSHRQIFGPVHDIDNALGVPHLRCLSVKVPIPDSLWTELECANFPRLVWIVLCRRYPLGYRHYLTRVLSQDVASWNRQGWQQQYWDSWSTGPVGTLKITCRLGALTLFEHHDCPLIKRNVDAFRGAGLGVPTAGSRTAANPGDALFEAMQCPGIAANMYGLLAPDTRLCGNCHPGFKWAQLLSHRPCPTLLTCESCHKVFHIPTLAIDDITCIGVKNDPAIDFLTRDASASFPHGPWCRCSQCRLHDGDDNFWPRIAAPPSHWVAPLFARLLCYTGALRHRQTHEQEFLEKLWHAARTGKACHSFAHLHLRDAHRREETDPGDIGLGRLVSPFIFSGDTSFGQENGSRSSLSPEVCAADFHSRGYRFECRCCGQAYMPDRIAMIHVAGICSDCWAAAGAAAYGGSMLEWTARPAAGSWHPMRVISQAQSWPLDGLHCDGCGLEMRFASGPSSKFWCCPQPAACGNAYAQHAVIVNASSDSRPARRIVFTAAITRIRVANHHS